MNIKGKVHCFFEQSGTFKNEFRKLGYEAEDYDIHRTNLEKQIMLSICLRKSKHAMRGGQAYLIR